MLQQIECIGAPRDLGLAQGRACRDAVRDHVARSGATLRRPRPLLAGLAALAPWSSGKVLGEGAGREILRHYPHLAERMAGLSLGADLPLESLIASLTRPAPSSSAVLHAPALALAGEAAGDAGSFACRTLVRSPLLGGRFLLRQSRPEVGFPSVELTLPWLASAVAGVNSEGVAVLLARCDASGDRAAPPLLLVQECLQRFAGIDGCLDWCMKRSVGGRARLFIADGEGQVAAVEFAGDERRPNERRVIRPTDGLLTEGASAAVAAELRKARSSPASADSGALAWEAALGAVDAFAAAEPDRGRHGVASGLAGWMTVRLETSSRRLIVQETDAAGFERRAEFVAT